MRRDQSRDTLLADQPDELLKHELRCVGIEVAGWFVGEKQLRRIRDPAANRGALLFAAGKLSRPVIDARPKSETGQQFACPCLWMTNVMTAMTTRIICGMTTFSSAENSGKS